MRARASRAEWAVAVRLLPIQAIAVRTRVAGHRVSVRVTNWREGCTDSSGSPRFVLRVVGSEIHVSREGAPRPIACVSAARYYNRSCGDEPCSPPPCVCHFDVAGTIEVPAAGAYTVLVEDGSGVRQRAQVAVP